MKNRDRIIHESFYEFLVKMNEQLQKNKAIIQIPRNENPRDYEYDEYYACVLDCIMDSKEVQKRCKFDCCKCIQAWMNEEPF